MEHLIDKTLQQIAETALSESVVRLELWFPDTYHEFVISFDVDNPTQYPDVESDDQPSNKIKTIIKQLMKHASGFFVDKDIIVTNYHVAHGTNSIIAELVDKQEKYQIESVEAYDIENDLILLKVNGEGVPLTIGDSTNIVGDDIICAAGYPNGNAEITHGAIDGISSSNQRIRMRIGTKGGSSGCPIFNSKGETIGVDVSGNDAYSFAISSNSLRALINKDRESIPLKEWQKLPQIRAITEKMEGDKFEKEGDYRKAIAHYDTAIRLKPEMVKAYQKRADAKIELCAIFSAFEDLITTRRLDPVSFSLSNFWDYVSWQRRGVWLWGIYSFILLLRNIFGKYVWSKFKGHIKTGIAKSRDETGDKTIARMLLSESIYDVTVAIRLKPKSAGTYNSRGWMKYLLGQLEMEDGNESKAQKLFEEAISDADTAIQSHSKKSKNVNAYYHTRGAAKAALGNHREAIEDYNESILLRPKKALFYQDRGLSNQAIGLETEADADFAKAKELDPKIDKKSKL